MLVAGRGASAASADLVEVAERFGAGAYVAFRCQDRFPVDHPHFLGHLGLAVPDAVLRDAYEADLVLTVGTRWDEVSSQRYTLPAAGAARVSLGRFDPGAGADWVAGEADALLRALLAYAPDQPPARDWTSGHAATEAFARPPAEVADEGAPDRLHPAAVVSALHRAVPSDAVVTNDAGNFAAFLHRYWRFGPGVAQLAPANGAMGFAVPAAVAAACVDRSRPAVAVVGDGGALMTGQELETATRLGLDVVVVVFQNAMYGTIAMHQARELGRTAAVSIADVDFTAWGRGLGAHACTVSTSAELDDALAEAFARPGPGTGRRPHRSRRHLTVGATGRAGRRPPRLSSTTVRHRHLAEQRPVVLLHRRVDDPRRLGQVRRQGLLGGPEVVGLHVRRTGVTITERLDQHVRRGVVDAARPVEPQAARFCPGGRGELGGDVGELVRVLGEDPELRGDEDHER